MPGPVFLEGDRLTLRLIHAEDHELIARHYNDPSVRYQAGVLRNPQPEDQIEALVEEDDASHFVPCRNETAVGHVMVRHIDTEASNAELAYVIFPDEAGNGYATEAADLCLTHAFEELGLHKVYARVVEGNDASMRVLEKLGFQEEGVFREHSYCRGEHRDMHYFGLVRSER